MEYENVRITRDDLIPMMADNAAIVAKVIELCRKNCPIDVISWALSDILGIRDITWDEIKQFIADAKALGILPEVTISGDALPAAIIRSAKVSGMGCANGNVWCTPPNESYTLRFYVNGVFKLAMQDYYITSLESIGAVPGDIVQIGRVVDDVSGWWNRITVP